MKSFGDQVSRGRGENSAAVEPANLPKGVAQAIGLRLHDGNSAVKRDLSGDAKAEPALAGTYVISISDHGISSL